MERPKRRILNHRAPPTRGHRSDTMYQNIIHGNATVLGAEEGWVIPGGRLIRDEARAHMYARRMANLMTGLEVVK